VEYAFDSEIEAGRGTPPNDIEFKRAIESSSPSIAQLAKGASDRARERVRKTSTPLPIQSEAENVMEPDSNSANALSALEVVFKFPDDTPDVTAHLSGVLSNTADMLKADFSSPPEFVMSTMCMQEILEFFVLPLATTILSSGEVLDVEGQGIAQLADTLIEQKSAAVLKGLFTLVIFYPSRQATSEWAFLGRSEPVSSRSQLCVQVRAVEGSLRTLTLSPAPADSPKSFEELLRQNHNLRLEDFLAWPGQQRMSKNFFIMAHPASHRAEAEMLSRYFREMGAQVWLPFPGGAWADFQSQGQGVVIVRDFSWAYKRISN
jgi:hypothetical protein